MRCTTFNDCHRKSVRNLCNYFSPVICDLCPAPRIRIHQFSSSLLDIDDVHKHVLSINIFHFGRVVVLKAEVSSVGLGLIRLIALRFVIPRWDGV